MYAKMTENLYKEIQITYSMTLMMLAQSSCVQSFADSVILLRGILPFIHTLMTLACVDDLKVMIHLWLLMHLCHTLE